MMKNSDNKKLVAIIIGLIIIGATFYYVYENRNKSNSFNVCIYPTNETFRQGEKLPIKIDVNPNTNNFQSRFESSCCVDNTSAFIRFNYIGTESSSDSPFLNILYGTTFVNGSCYYISDRGYTPISISNSNALLQNVYWNGTTHIIYNNCSKSRFVEANAGYYKIYVYLSLISIHLGKTSPLNDVVKFKNSLITLTGLFVNYSINSGHLNFTFNQFHSSCKFDSGYLTIMNSNGTKVIETGLKFPGYLSLNVTNLEKQLSQKSIVGDIAIVHNRYGNIWLLLN